MKKLLSITIASVLVCGCVSVGRKLDSSKVAQIKKGETTRQQVINLIGSPDQMTQDGNGNVMFQYIYVRASAKPATYIPVVGAFAGGANTQNQMVMVTFGSDGIVSDIVTSYGANETGTGLNVGSEAKMPEVQGDKRGK